MEQQNSILENNAAALNKPCIDYICFYEIAVKTLVPLAAALTGINPKLYKKGVNA